MTHNSIISSALQTFSNESKAIAKLGDFIDNSFVECVRTIQKCKGRLIVSGIGKSGIVATKIVATLNSTGTPAIFMHAADAIHGDLGLIQKNDLVLVISKSGNSPEIKALVPYIKNLGNPIIGMVGNMQSFLALNSNFVLNTTIDKEACPNNLAPTTSTTAQMAMGDALAVCLLELNGFTSTDFAKYHPGGALGKKLFIRVSDLIVENNKPSVTPQTALKDVIVSISHSLLGITVVLDGPKIAGVITDGDLRRMLEKTTDLGALTARDVMCSTPKTIELNSLATEALYILEKQHISQLVVTNNNLYAGVLHLHNLVKEGIL